MTDKLRKMKPFLLITVLLSITAISNLHAQATGPKIKSFSPAGGPVGTTVIIEGSGFSAIADSNVVNFGATHAKVNSASTTRLSVTVPVGASYQPIMVSNKESRLTTHSTLPFNLSFFPETTDIEGKVRFSADTGASDVRLADIDGDGKADILAINPKLRILMVFRNTSASGSINKKSFAPPVVYPTGVQPAFVAVDDLDGDGRLDIALINGSYSYGLTGHNSLAVFKNSSTPGKIKLTNFQGDSVSAVNTIISGLQLNTGDDRVRIADMDGDGKPDIAVLNTAGTVTIYRNIYVPKQDTLAKFALPVIFQVGNDPTEMVIGDVDGDGRPDIMTANANGFSTTLLQNTSSAGAINTGSFIRTDQKFDFSPAMITLADMDSDGKPDFVVSSADNNYAAIVHNTTSSGHFNETVAGLSNIHVFENFDSEILLQDINGDGKPDLLTTNTDLDSVYLYTNKSAQGQTGPAYFNPKLNYKIALIPDAIGDLDGDGMPDIVIASCFGIDVYRSQYTGPPVSPPVQAKNDFSIYPNPSSVTANIKYNLPNKSDVIVKIYTVTGELIASYTSSGEEAGNHEYALSTSNLRTGVYLVSLNATGYNKAGKLLVVQ